MTRYESLVSYNAPTGRSVRGSVGAELISRCVVEALASTLYRVLADTSAPGVGRRLFSTLAQDEARHFGMFLKMLNAEAISAGRIGVLARCRHAARRMLDLEDAQIMVASRVVAGRGDGLVRLRREANWYLARLYRLYRWKHLRYAARMLLQTIGLRPTRPLTALCTLALWFGVKMRRLWASAFSRGLPPASAGPTTLPGVSGIFAR